MINSNTLMIDTSGFKVGQINGLTVMNLGNYSFGLPVKLLLILMLVKTEL